MKTQVLEVIGETDLNRSAQVDAALAANDRIKYCFSLLQGALAHADHPEQPADSLRRERLACGAENSSFDNLIANAGRENGRYRIPGWPEVFAQIVRDIRIMAVPAPPQFTARLERLLSRLPESPQQLIERGTIDDLTRAQGEPDSLHRLVMDLHKVLNAMHAELAEERLDGAAIHHIEDSDRPLIAAFMAGLNRTAWLKFNHPGLETTATRVGSRLIIQNDLGTTDAHVIVIHVEGLNVRFTHTDVHAERLQFLREMLRPYAVSWGEQQTEQAQALAAGAPFYLTTGSFEAKDAAGLCGFLGFLASRLVFLIDWNRARKELRGFLRAPDRIALLAWAAEAEVGHRAFLELGGARLMNRAIENTAGSAMHFGDRLCDVLGDEDAMSCVRSVFRAAMEGLRDHQSNSLIQDRVRAELQAHFSSEGKRLLQLAGEQAAIIFEIASLVRNGVHDIESGDRDGQYRRLAQQAREFEHNADQLVAASREAVRRRPEYTPLFQVLESADDAADELEEVAFLMELLVESEPQGDALEALAALADLLVEAAQEWVKALAHAEQVDHFGSGKQDEARDFLTAIDAVFALEHRTDDAERALTYAAVQKARDFRQLHIYSAMAQSLEQASDALKWAGLNARDYLLGNA